MNNCAVKSWKTETAESSEEFSTIEFYVFFLSLIYRIHGTIVRQEYYYCDFTSQYIYIYIPTSVFVYCRQNKFLTKLIYKYCIASHISLNIYLFQRPDITRYLNPKENGDLCCELSFSIQPL